ncbi:MAG: Hpt domain-containing protein, partial [Treponemataceae bacterium]
MSDYLDPNNEELLKDFFSEAQSQVDTLEQNILVLENESGNRDAVDEIFRAAHTLKGGAATVEMSELAGFTHLVEDVLDAIRSDAVTVDEAVIDVLLAAIDIIKAMLAERMEGRVYAEDVSSVEERLAALLPAGTSRKKPKAKSAAAQVPAPVVPVLKADEGGKLSEYDILEMTQAAEPGKPVYCVSVTFNEDNVMNTVGGIQVFAALKDMGSVLRTVPDFEKLYEDTFFPTVDYYISSARSPEDFKRRVSIPDVTLSSEVSLVGAQQTTEKAPIATKATPAAASVKSAAPVAASVKSASPVPKSSPQAVAPAPKPIAAAPETTVAAEIAEAGDAE